MTTPLITPCVGCNAKIDCPDDAAFPYSLTGPPAFPFVVNCPPGFDCANADSVSMLCCTTVLTTLIPQGSSSAQRLLLVQRMIDNCRATIPVCEGVPTVPPNVTDFFFSRTKSAGFNCPTDQGLFGQYTYTVPAGRWISPTQREADELAQEDATNFANANHFCAKVPPLCPCALTEINYTIPIVGGNAPFTFTGVSSGHLPSGVTASTGSNIKLTGTIRTMGTFEFSLRVQDSTRGILTVPLSMHASQIGYETTLASGFTAPAVLSTVTATVVATANVSVGDIVSISKLVSGVVTQEYGTLQVMAVDTPSGGDLLLKNLTVSSGIPLASGLRVSWPLAALPEFEQGVPYSFQMPYGDLTSWAFNITAGTLPDGLLMSIEGLISGTPTGITGSVLDFLLLDPLCGVVDKTFYRPSVRLSGTSTKTTATIKGYEEWPGFRSTPPKKYKTITWNGRSALSARTWDGTDTPHCHNGAYVTGGNSGEGGTMGLFSYPSSSSGFFNFPAFGYGGIGQFLTGDASVVTPPPPSSPGDISFVIGVGTPQPCAAAFYLFTGSGSINDAGIQISNYEVQRWVSCVRYPLGPPVITQPDFGFSTLVGFCIPNEPCPTCASPPLFERDIATNDPLVDGRDFITHGNFVGLKSVSSTFANRDNDGGTQAVAVDPPLPTNIRISDVNGFCAPWVLVTYDRNYSATLSDEYTDAIAISNAKVTTGNSVVSESLPRTTGFISIWQSVVWKLTCSNLVFGERYNVFIDFVTSLGVVTTHSESFIASGTTRVLTGSVPTPVDGQTITATNPRIGFVIN